MPILTFEEFLPKNTPAYKSHESKGPLTFDEMLPEERVEEFGKVEKFTTTERIVDQIKRSMNVGTNALMGDVPFVRKMLPKNIRESEPQTPTEKTIVPLMKVGRDIGIYSKAGKLVKPLADIRKTKKWVKGTVEVISEGVKGGVLGAVTAESEDPIDIARKAGVYGGLVAATVPAIAAASWAGSKVVGALEKSKNLSDIAEWLGMKMREGPANDLVRKRYGEINSRLIDSEKYIDDLSKQITPKENKSLAFLVESGSLDKLPSGRMKTVAQSIRKYLDDAHAELMKDYGKDVGFIKDYIPHMWDIPKNKEKAVINWFITRNPHLRRRRIETIEEGIKKFGLKPKYENVTDILRVYDQVRIKSAANLKFVQDLKELEQGGIKLVQRSDKAPKDWPIVDHPAVRRAMMVGKTTTKVPVEETTRLVTKTLEKIRTIEKTVAGGGVVKNKEGVIKKLEEVMTGALESRGMTKGEAESYIGRLKAAYAGAEIGEASVKESVSDKIEESVKQAIFKVQKKQSVEVPILSKVPVRVHPSIYPDVKAVLDTYQPGRAASILDKTNTLVKQSVLNLSLFHHIALTETSVAAGMGKKAINLWNPVKIIKAFKNGTYKSILQQDTLAKVAVKDGLNIGAISDVEGGRALVNVLKNTEKVLKNGIVATGIKALVRKPLEFNNKFLWDYLHTSYKLNAYSKLKVDMIKAYPNKSVEVIGKEVAQFVNDTFGGQPWEIMAKSKQWQQFSRFLLLSPDWVLSTMKQAVSPFGVGAASKAGKEIRKELGKNFWRRAIVYFGGSMNLLNYAYTKAYKGEGKFLWDNPPGKETYLFTGYNPDGTERYLRWGKQFRELAEAINKPTEVAGRKISPLIRITKHQVWPSEVWQREIADNPFWSKAGLVGRAKQIGKDVTPYSISQSQRIGAVNPMGFAMPVSRGMTPYNTRKYFREAILRQDKELFMRTYEAALNNEIDPDPIFKQAISAIKSEKAFEAKLDAKKIVMKLRSLDNEERAPYLNELEANGEMTPALKQQVLKILKQKSSAKKKKKVFEKSRGKQ